MSPLAFAKPRSRASMKRAARTAENVATGRLRLQVFERDRYLCRVCEVLNNPLAWERATDMHEIVFRSQNGRRTLANTVALCHAHHMAIHSRRLWIVGTDANGPLQFVTEKPDRVRGPEQP